MCLHVAQAEKNSSRVWPLRREKFFRFQKKMRFGIRTNVISSPWRHRHQSSPAEGEVREENFRHYKPAPVRHTCSVYFANVKIMFLLLREGSFPGESQLLRHRQWAWWRRGKFLFSGKFKKIFIRESSESSNGYVWFSSWEVFCLSEHSRIYRWIILSWQGNFFKHSSLLISLINAMVTKSKTSIRSRIPSACPSSCRL